MSLKMLILPIGFLFLISGCLDGGNLIGGDHTPNDLVILSINTSINFLGIPAGWQDVAFDKGDSLSTRTIIEQSKAEQVCVSISPLTQGYENFTYNGETVRYNGDLSQRFSIFVICETANKLEETLKEFGFVENSEDKVKYNLDISSCNLDNRNTLCYVSIVPTD